MHSAAWGQAQVVGWGRNSVSQLSTGATPLLPYLQVAAGLYHNAALRADGTIACWGYDFFGQCRVPASVGSVRQVGAGGFHTLACRVDGLVVAWGDNSAGQCLGTDGSGAALPGVAVGQPVRILGQTLRDVTSVAAGDDFSVALRVDKSVVCWGKNDRGQCSVPTGMRPVAQIEAGAAHAIALLDTGEVVCWGANAEGQSLGTQADGTSITGSPSGQPIQIEGEVLDDVVEVAAGYQHSVARRSDGSVVGWGGNSFGQIDFPRTLAQVTRLSAGWYHSLAVMANGEVRCFGRDSLGQSSVPPGMAPAVEATGGSEHSIALLRDGTVLCWGGNRSGERSVPRTSADITRIAAGGNHTIVLRSDGSVDGWGWGLFGQTTVPAGLPAADQVSAGGGHSVARLTNGQLVAWGDNSDGRCLGTDASGAPILGAASGASVRVDGQVLSAVADFAAGFDHTVAVDGVGQVYAWGNNFFGQCTIPESLVGVSSLAAGGAHSLAIRSDGTVVGWGWNDFGQCLGTSVDGAWIAGSVTGDPVRILGATLQGIVQVAAGYDHSVGLRSNGLVVCWGSDDSGQCSVPAGLANVTRVAAGWSCTLALRSDGRVVGWGYNKAGQCLGTDPDNLPLTSAPRGQPVVLRGATLQTAVDLASGWDHVVVLLPEALSACGHDAGAGRATLNTGGSAWDNVGVWSWTQGGSPQVPGALTDVDFGEHGSVGSHCDARAASLTTRSGTTLLVPTSDFEPAIRVGGSAILRGRVWLLGVPEGAAVLPADPAWRLPVLSAGSVTGSFDLIQTEVPPPPGFFLTLVEEVEGNGKRVSFRVLPLLQGQSGLSGASAGQCDGGAIAAETIDIDHDGFDDLALALDQGAGQPGRIQILLNDGTGNLGGSSLLFTTPPQPTCLAVGDVDGDGRRDLVVGLAGDQTVRAYLDDGAGGLEAGFVISDLNARPTAVVVIPPPGNGVLPGGTSVGVGLQGGKMRIYQNDVFKQEVSMAGTVETVRGGNTGGTQGMDIVTGGSKSASVALLATSDTGFVEVLRRQPSGSFISVQRMFMTARPVRLDVADLDGDDLDDIVTANVEPQVPVVGSVLPVLTVFRNADGVFGGAVPYQPEGASSGLDVSLIDVDADGDHDIVSVYRRIGEDSEAALLRVDTAGAATPLSIGATTVLDLSDPTTGTLSNPVLSARGNLNGTGGDDLFLVNAVGSGNLTALARVRPFLDQTAREGDLDRNGVVDYADVAMCLLDFGPCVGCTSDMDGNGLVDYGDVALVLLNFG